METKTFKHSFNKIALIILSIWLLSCSSPKVLYKSTQSVDFDSIQRIYDKRERIYLRKSTFPNIDKTMIMYGDYHHNWSSLPSFKHVIERKHDTLTFYYSYKESSPQEAKDTSSSVFYSTQIIGKSLSKKIKRYQKKSYRTIKDPKREGYMIIILPLNGDKITFLDIDENGLKEDRKERRKFRQTRVLFKRIAKRYYDIPKEYIKY